MHIIFFDPPVIRESLKPFTFTRPVAAIRTGIWTLAEKWINRLPHISQPSAYLTEAYLQDKFPFHFGDDNLVINGAVCPDSKLLKKVQQLKTGQILLQQDRLVAARFDRQTLLQLQQDMQASSYEQFEEHCRQYAGKDHTVTYEADVSRLEHNWDIFQQNGAQIAEDFPVITAGRVSGPIPDPHTIVYNRDQVFIEPGVSIRAAIINAEDGPVYIGKNATIHENAVIKGPFAMLEGTHVNIGAKIREATTLGPYCKVGGEVKNTVFFANSSKGHEGFIGNAVIGEWCNFGADTNCSNLKNNYKNVSIWHYGKKAYIDTGLLFCGLLMGDHSKCGINTMFNTGTVVGVSCNIYGSGYPSKHLPSFSWGGTQQQYVYDLNRAIEVARAVLQRRNLVFTEADQRIFSHIFGERMAAESNNKT